MGKRSRRVLATAAMAVLTLPAAAQDQWISTTGDWSAFQFTAGEAQVCYMASTPLDMEPKNVNRGGVFVQVTHDGRVATRDVVSVIAGYTFEASSTVVATIGPVEFRMFTDRDGAWNPTPEQDRAMVQAMISGASMTVVGHSSRGTETHDLYSLLGFTAAYRAIEDACDG
jgi:hypothetical protein